MSFLTHPPDGAESYGPAGEANKSTTLVTSTTPPLETFAVTSDSDAKKPAQPDLPDTMSGPEESNNNHSDGAVRTIRDFRWLLVCMSLYVS